MILKQFLFATGVTATVLLGACSSFQSNSDHHSQDKATTAQAQPASEADPIPTRAFEGDSLYELLLAEFAGKRNRADVALGKYLKQAHETRDPQVVERATYISRYLGAHQATLDAAMLWSEIDPKNTVPRELIATELIRMGKLDEALEQIDLLLASDGSMNFEYLLQATRAADKETRQRVLEKLREYSKQTDNDKLWFAKGSLEAMNGNHEVAIKDYDKALKIKPNYTNAILGRVQSLIATKEQDVAMIYLAQKTSLWPENKRLGVVYARYLVQLGQLEEAEQQFFRLSQAFPHDGDLVLSLALLSWENQQNEKAKEYFSRLIQMQHRPDEANIYLARIALSEKNNDLAIKHFLQVTDGPNYPLAQIQLAMTYHKMGNSDQGLSVLDTAMANAPEHHTKFQMTKSEILADQGDIEGAIGILTEALNDTPEDTNILYSRAMLKERNNDFSGMEEDLRSLLALQPDNSAALNALGYTFADRNQRLSEAWELIEKAYTLNPEDPAIIDSMGWIKYRMGDISAALDFLRKAYAAFDDQEIAAHLGEVLWVTGKQEEATKIWRKALEDFPDSAPVKEAMERLIPAQ